jgi:hypothetical protein
MVFNMNVCIHSPCMLFPSHKGWSDCAYYIYISLNDTGCSVVSFVCVYVLVLSVSLLVVIPYLAFGLLST